MVHLLKNRSHGIDQLADFGLGRWNRAVLERSLAELIYWDVVGAPEGLRARVAKPRKPDMAKSLCKGFRMSRIANNPLLLGFEDIEHMLERIAKTSGDGYPPYNIERIRPAGGAGEKIRIILAVAGFRRDDLEIFVEDNQLTIRGKQESDTSRTYLHRGIASRQFQRAFVLADGLTVLSAELDNGLLSIELMRPEPTRHVRRIEIRNRS